MKLVDLVRRLAEPLKEPSIGDPFLGGFYVGKYLLNAITYYLIVADKSSEVATRWSNSSATGATSPSDGMANTQLIVASTTSSAALVCTQYVDTSGNNDYYLPSINELALAYHNLKPDSTENNTQSDTANSNAVPSYPANTTNTPTTTKAAAFQAGGAQAFETSYYWSSVEASSTTANRLFFQSDLRTTASKSISTGGRVRPFRKVVAPS